MPARKYSIANTGYRYGFNGKEKDNDIENGAQDYGMRIYDPRLVRFLSVDPISKKYPELTPFQFASNSPIANIDLDGLEKVIYTITRITEGGTQIKKVSVKTLYKPGSFGSGAAVILNKDGIKSYMYGEESKDMKDFVSYYEGRQHKVYPSLEGGAPTGGIGHKLNDPRERKEFPVGTVLSDATIDKWFNKDWRDKTTIVERNESTKGFLGGQKEALTDFVFNGLRASNFKKGDDETFFLGFLKGQNGTVKKRIGQTILFRDNKKYNLEFLKDKSSQQKLENLATPKKDKNE